MRKSKPSPGDPFPPVGMRKPPESFMKTLKLYDPLLFVVDHRGIEWHVYRKLPLTGGCRCIIKWDKPYLDRRVLDVLRSKDPDACGKPPGMSISDWIFKMDEERIEKLDKDMDDQVMEALKEGKIIFDHRYTVS